MSTTLKQVIEFYNGEGQHNTAKIAKALSLTHTMAQMKGASIDSVIKAMDTQETGAGKEWVAAGFDPGLIQSVSLNRRVSSLFQRVNMPRNPYTFPVQGGPATAYITPENTADSGQTSVKFSNAGTANTTLTAKKLSAAVRVSDELEQDSIVDIAPVINRSILEGLVNAEEDALINGDTAGTHMDADVTGADDARKTFKGLRSLANSNAKVDAGASGLDTLTKAVRALRSKMKQYAVNPDDVVLITSIDGYYGLMNEGTVITQDKYGANATILTGELARFDGIPVVTSAYVRTDLDATGVRAASASNKTVILLVNRRSFAIGDRQRVEMEDVREGIYGQDALIGRERIDFQKWFAANENPVGVLYNVPTL